MATKHKMNSACDTVSGLRAVSPALEESGMGWGCPRGTSSVLDALHACVSPRYRTVRPSPGRVNGGKGVFLTVCVRSALE